MSVELPLGSPEFWADPYPTWAALRDDQPVYWWETAGAWVVFDHEHAANHDPEVFPDPTDLDLERDSNRAVLFGLGSHYCIGAALARLEVATVLRRFFERFPGTTLDSTPTWGDHVVLRGLKHLPVVL